LSENNFIYDQMSDKKNKKDKKTSGKVQDSSRFVKASRRVLAPYRPAINNYCKTHAELEKKFLVQDEKTGQWADGSPLADMLLSTKSMLKGMLGSREVTIELGGYSALTTTNTTLLTYSTYGTTTAYQTIPMALSTLGVNWTSEYAQVIGGSALWDEFKTVAIRFKYNPYNPYNRGTTTNSDPIALMYDDENINSSTGSISTMNIWSNRGPDRFVPFSLDHSFEHTFRRPMPMSEYPWCNSNGDTTTVNGGNGGVSLAYDNTALTASIRYGTMQWTFEVMCRMRI